MHSWEIVKWQDNVAEDIRKNQFNYNENLINAILEVACQVAKLREDLSGKKLLPDVNVENEIKPIALPPEFFNKDGEIDLSKVTGEQARKYFIHVLGIKFPVGVSKVK